MPGKTEKGTDFILRLSGVELPDADRERIAAELRATFMRELAKTDTGGGSKKAAAGAGGGGGGGSAFLIPKGWNGGKFFRDVRNLGEELTRFGNMRIELKEIAM